MLWSARYPEEIHLERSDFRGRHFNTVLAARPCLCDIVPSKSKLVGRSKPCNWLGFLHKVSRICFFPNDYPLHYLHHFGVCSIFGSKQYDSRAAITQSGGDKPCCDLSGQNLSVRMMSWKRAWLLSFVQNGGNDVWISDLFGDDVFK